MSHQTIPSLKATSSGVYKLQNNLDNKSKSLEKWVEELAQYERMLEGMTKANLAPTFKEELSAVESWFIALEEGERTASLYTLIHKCSPVLVRFLITILQKIAKSHNQEQEQSQGLPTFSDYSRSISNVSIPMLKHSSSNSSSSGSSNGSPSDVPSLLPGEEWRTVGVLNKVDSHSNLPRKLKTTELDIKAAVHWGQREMNVRLDRPHSAALISESAWRAKFSPKSLKSPAFPPGLKSPSLKSPSIKSPAAWTPTDVHFPVEKPLDPVDFNLLNDIPQWMRSLRLHKYTPLFSNKSWQEIVILDDTKLSSLGVAALGARRKFLKIFDHIRKEAKSNNIIIKDAPEENSPDTESQIASDASMEDLTKALSLNNDIKV